MKITGAWIDDPTLHGKLEKSRLCVEVTEMPDSRIPTQTLPDGWSTGKYGPFVKYSSKKPCDAGDYNIRFRGQFPPIVDVSLFLPDSDLSIEGFGLPLARARQLAKKYCGEFYRLEMSARDGEQRGVLLWEPIAVRPACRHWSRHKTCGKVPTKRIVVNGVDTFYCAEHIQKHNDAQAERRMSSK